MKFLSLTNILTTFAIVYLAYTSWVLYGVWNPPQCDIQKRKDFCSYSFIHLYPNKNWKLKLYSTDHAGKFDKVTAKLVKTWNQLNFTQDRTEKLDVILPTSTKNNGSLYLHFFLYLSGESAFSGGRSIHRKTSLTQHIVPESYFNLLAGNSSEGVEKSHSLPVTHWRPELSVNIMADEFTFDIRQFPEELHHLLKFDKERNYLPIFYVDELSQKITDLKVLPENANNVSLKLTYSPISIGKLRMWLVLSNSMKLMKDAGFTDKDLDDVKGIFTDTNFYFLALTVFVSVFHMLFDFLAFKNDISYWKSRESMAGLSFHTAVYRCVSTIIVFLYLHDQRTSLLILAPSGIGAAIEVWKLKKAMKMQVIRASWWRINFRFLPEDESEKSTHGFDQEALKYLSYLLYPLCLASAVYSLFYVPHKSVYSWIIQSLVNGVYAFGFLFMLPQLFINYKLKSVAHLPWRAFTYKAFNTFIDDVFAFIVRMPTSHRIACFRDDIVFFCYLYQLWLYPVDKKRANEFGICYEKPDDDSAKNSDDDSAKNADDDSAKNADDDWTKDPEKKKSD